MNIEISDYGVARYADILALQQSLFDKLKESKQMGRESKEYLLIGEHEPVVTLGRRADKGNLLVSESMLASHGIGLYHIGRGGDVTFHGPGQLVVYPILDLDLHHLGVKDYVNLLEETVIILLKKYGIKAGRVEGATGVWLGEECQGERKICAIGIKCSRFCTMHGLALNVNTDLTGFSLINPCGFKDKGVTSMQLELGEELDMGRIKEDFLHIFLRLIFPFEEIFDFPE